MSFIKDQFLLTTKTAQRLFQEVAAREPIFDFHSHLSPAQLVANRPFSNPAELFLTRAAAKTQLMRAFGVDERLLTGEAEPFEQFVAFAKTISRALRHPLYDATHLELKRLFGLDWLLHEKTARPIWDAVQAKLKSPDATPRGLLRKFRVIVQCIVTDATESLEPFRAVQTERGALRLLPNFRADAAWQSSGDDFPAWCDRLAAATGEETETWDGFRRALAQRQEEFHALGCRVADYELAQIPAAPAPDPERLFTQIRTGENLLPGEQIAWSSGMFRLLTAGQIERGWTLHLHLGAAETGFHDLPQTAALASFLAAHPKAKCLLDVRNPAALEAAGSQLSAAGQLDLSEPTRGTRGLEERLNVAARCGLLGRSVGVSSGAHSLADLVRHEHFRRVLCAMIGREFEEGLIPHDWDLAAKTVRDICYRNAARFLGIDTQIG